MSIAELIAYCLAKPDAWPDEPWDGDPVAKVGNKIFAFFGEAGDHAAGGDDAAGRGGNELA